MYVPRHFAEDDRQALAGIIERHNFGLLVNQVAGAPFASHLPFLLEGNRLLAHMARGNPQWRAFVTEAPVLVVFSGPHAYVSPRWYASPRNVPTWNYEAVHVQGVPRVIEEGAGDLLERLVARHESDAERPWRPGDAGLDYVQGMTRGIVAFEIPVDRIEGKRKLGQNRTPEDRRAAAAHLRNAADPMDREIGRLMASLDE